VPRALDHAMLTIHSGAVHLRYVPAWNTRTNALRRCLSAHADHASKGDFPLVARTVRASCGKRRRLSDAAGSQLIMVYWDELMNRGLNVMRLWRVLDNVEGTRQCRRL
jgi:hypothetical protein